MTTLTQEQMSAVRDAISSENYKTQADQVRALIAIGFPKPASMKKDDVIDYLYKRSETTEISDPVITQPELITEPAAVEAVTQPESELVEAPVVVKEQPIAEEFIPNAESEVSAEPITLSAADIDRLKAIIVMRDPVEVINWAEDLAGYDGNDSKEAYKLLGDVLERHGHSRDPVADLLDKPKSSRRRAATAAAPKNRSKDGDKIICQPEEVVKSLRLGSKVDYIVKALSRPEGATLAEVELLQNLEDNVKPAIAQNMGISVTELAIAPLTADPESVTQILADLEAYGITPGGDIPKNDPSRYQAATEGYLACRLQHQSPFRGYGCKRVSGRYHILLPGDATDLPENIQNKMPSDRVKTPRAPRASQDDIADLKSQNDSLQAQLEEMKAMIMALHQKQA